MLGKFLVYEQKINKKMINSQFEISVLFSSSFLCYHQHNKKYETKIQVCLLKVTQGHQQAVVVKKLYPKKTTKGGKYEDPPLVFQLMPKQALISTIVL